MTLPSIDNDICQSWTQTDMQFYNALPQYFVKETTEYRKDWAVFDKYLGSIPWQANAGREMKAIIPERSPVLRQSANPNLLSERPLLDIPLVRERTAVSKPAWQDFQTVAFPFYPSFTDFLVHVQDSLKDLNRQVVIFEQMYYKTVMFNAAPYVYVAGVGLVNAPTSGTDPSTGKNDAWVAAQLASCNSTLNYAELMNALNKFTQQCGGTPYSGSGLPSGDSMPLSGKYGLVTPEEQFNAWVSDPWVLNNRMLSTNVVTAAQSGDPFGRFLVNFDPYPRRYRVAGALGSTATMEAPETVELDPDSPQYQRTFPNPLYADPASSQYTVSWLFGGMGGYKKLKVGPPPGDWRSVNPAMNWNGKAELTKDFLIPCTLNGVTSYEQNATRGRQIMGVASATVGMLGVNTFNVLPIIHKRPLNIIPTITGPISTGV
jgi:hypothetical protein